MKSTLTAVKFIWAITILALAVVPNSGIFSQDSAIPSQIQVSATGTGKTTGHIMDVTFVNPTGQKVKVDVGACYIPSSGQYQPYIIPRLASITVPANGQLTVPVNGYCADIHKPPVPMGQSIVPVEKWIMPEPLAQNWKPLAANGWTPSGGGMATIPGTDVPLGYRIDINQHPEEVAPVMLEAINRISKTFGELQGSGEISTPFSGNAEKERESVIQQTFWIYTSELTGQPYKVQDFATNTAEQYEATSGKKLKDLTPPEQDQMVSGIADFWGTFQAVGAQAKVLESGTKPPEDVQFGFWTDIKDWLFAPDYSKVKKADDFDNFRRTKYDKYEEERAINKKSHEDACKAIDIDSDSDFADACKRVYGK